MKTIIFLISSIIVGISTSSFAQVIPNQVQTTPTATSPIISWVSDSASDKVTIENGTGAMLNIVLNVNDDGSGKASGINIINCGETTHIDPGSSAICKTNDPKNPVTFNSDSANIATGTYQITQELPQ